MPATAPDAEKFRELDEDKRRAWAEYVDGLRELSGKEYDEAEGDSWERLQAQLTQLDDQRKRLADDAG